VLFAYFDVRICKFAGHKKPVEKLVQSRRPIGFAGSSGTPRGTASERSLGEETEPCRARGEQRKEEASRSVSRVLYRGARPLCDDHLSRSAVACRLQQPTRKSTLRTAAYRRICSFLFGFAPDGVYRASQVTLAAGELLPHRFTLTTRRKRPFGGLLSAALSLISRPVGVTDHPVLWSPDFPPATAKPPATVRPTRLISWSLRESRSFSQQDVFTEVFDSSSLASCRGVSSPDPTPV
jgi:hypothetical protein